MQNEQLKTVHYFKMCIIFKVLISVSVQMRCPFSNTEVELGKPKTSSKEEKIGSSLKCIALLIICLLLLCVYLPQCYISESRL